MPAPCQVIREGAVATVLLDRPEHRNALDLALKESLLDALDQISRDTEVRAVVLAGSGPAFCVGQDLREHATGLGTGEWERQRTVERHYNPIVRTLTTMPQPVVAAVHGACVGAGLGIAMACDLRVFADDAVLGTAFGGVGLTFDSGLSATLTWAVGAARARELVLLGDTFDPASAVAWGIAGKVVAPDEVRDVAHGLAVRLAQGAPLAQSASKRLVAAAPYRSLEESLAAEASEQDALGRTADHREAVAAFLERRTPRFTGR